MRFARAIGARQQEPALAVFGKMPGGVVGLLERCRLLRRQTYPSSWLKGLKSQVAQTAKIAELKKRVLLVTLHPL